MLKSINTYGNFNYEGGFVAWIFLVLLDENHFVAAESENVITWAHFLATQSFRFNLNSPDELMHYNE